MSAFLSFRRELACHAIDLHPSELHGLLVGYLCAVKGGAQSGQRASRYAQWLGGNLPPRLHHLLEAAFGHALEHLDEYADFDFALLTPDDDAPIGERARAVALWCTGFLSGFGEAGGQAQSDAAEALGDLARIAAMADEVPEDEDNESDLTQIVEFVRVSTLLIFDTSPGVH